MSESAAPMTPSVSFDSRADALTVVFRDAPVDRTIEVEDGRQVDLDAEGNVVAIEVLGVSAGNAQVMPLNQPVEGA